jgi:hypothetical protein
MATERKGPSALEDRGSASREAEAGQPRETAQETVGRISRRQKVAASFAQQASHPFDARAETHSSN